MAADPNKMDKKVLLNMILGVGTLLYIIAVFWIGIGSIGHVKEINAAAQKAPAQSAGGQLPETPADGEETKSPEPYPISDFITQALLVIGGALATHLGAYLGISITDDTQGFRKGTDLLAYIKTAEGLSGVMAAAYFLTLAIAIVFWASTGFSPYAGKPLQDLAYSFLGIFAGAMAALSKG